MASPLSELLAEASDPTTPSARLRAISQLQKTSEATAIRQALAANPNLDEELLWDLAIECPAAAADNPGLQLIQLREPAWWTQCGTGALLSLLSVMGADAPEEARDFLLKTMTNTLMLASPLALTGEYTLCFSEEISVAWSPLGDHEVDSNSDDDADCDEAIQEFTLDFKCAVESYSRLTAGKKPGDAKELCRVLAALLPDTGDSADLNAIADCGWSLDCDSMGDGYWELDDYEPNLPDWELESTISGDGSGSVIVTDPTGLSHEFTVDGSGCEGKESTPTLDQNLVAILISHPMDNKLFLSRLKAALLLD